MTTVWVGIRKSIFTGKNDWLDSVNQSTWIDERQWCIQADNGWLEFDPDVQFTGDVRVKISNDQDNRLDARTKVHILAHLDH